MNRNIVSHDPLQDGYTYELVASEGKDFNPEFKPDLTPKQMLELGVFGGTYFEEDGDGDALLEFPKEWLTHAKREVGGTYRKPNAKLNHFGINASQTREYWQEKGWIYKDDPRGWFQWYCRYYLGRRIPDEDARQIKRWKAIGRHIMQVKKHCRASDETCRPRQRQAILHWAYDSRKI